MHRSAAALVIPAIFLSASVVAAPAPVKVEVLQTKLDHPWSLAFLPDDARRATAALAAGERYL